MSQDFVVRGGWGLEVRRMFQAKGISCVKSLQNANCLVWQK